MTKPFWQSKTMIANVLAGALAFAQTHFGWNLGISADDQLAILAVLNLVLRAVTKGAVTLS